MTQPLTDAINALTRYANETTGASDQTLSDAVRTLCDGYGGGGGDTLKELMADTLVTYSSDFAGEVRDNCFSTAGNLESVSLPNATRLKGNCFAYCNKLNSVFLPKVNTIWGNSNFRSCNALEAVAFPSLVNCMNSGGQFFDTGGLRVADMGQLHTGGFGNNFFFNCAKFTGLILRYTDGVCPLASTGAFTRTPFASGGTGGTLYVPQALISSYQSANNWSTILGYANNQILPIEGSIYETQYADGTPIE